MQQLYELKVAESQSEVPSSFSTLEKLQLFNDLFVGRRDVYARGFQSKKYNRIGYTPACANADNSDLCQRGKIRCLDCPNRVFAKLDLKAIKMHLQGQDEKGRHFIAGLYPLMVDDTCKLLEVDFNSENMHTRVWKNCISVSRKYLYLRVENIDNFFSKSRRLLNKNSFYSS